MGDQIIRNTEASWTGFANTLVSDFKSQFGAQTALFQQLTSKFTEMLKNPQGFSQQALSALRGGTVGQIANQFNQARQGVQATQAARGDFGSDVKSGVNAQISGQIAGQQAGATASGLDEIEQANEQQKINNQNIAIGGLKDVASMENPNGLAGEANQGASTIGNLGSQYYQTNQNGLGQQLQNSFGSAVGKIMTGGISALSGVKAPSGGDN